MKLPGLCPVCVHLSVKQGVNVKHQSKWDNFRGEDALEACNLQVIDILFAAVCRRRRAPRVLKQVLEATACCS